MEVEANQNIDEPIAKMFANMIDRLKTALSKGNYVARQTLATLSQQMVFYYYFTRRIRWVVTLWILLVDFLRLLVKQCYLGISINFFIILTVVTREK